jgi:hypothetical protein
MRYAHGCRPPDCVIFAGPPRRIEFRHSSLSASTVEPNRLLRVVHSGPLRPTMHPGRQTASRLKRGRTPPARPVISGRISSLVTTATLAPTGPAGRLRPGLSKFSRESLALKPRQLLQLSIGSAAFWPIHQVAWPPDPRKKPGKLRPWKGSPPSRAAPPARLVQPVSLAVPRIRPPMAGPQPDHF